MTRSTAPPARPPSPRRDPLAVRLVVPLAVVLGVALLLWRARMPLPFALNSGWDEYARLVDYIWLPGREPYYNPWRKPAPFWVVGAWARLADLPQYRAAFHVSTLACASMVVSAAVVARQLAGRAAAVVAALVVPALPTVVEACHWNSAYPVLGATFGLTLAAGAAHVRRPHPARALLVVLAACLSVLVDHRGLVAVAAAAVLLGAAWRPGRSWRVGLALAALGGAFWGTSQVEAHLAARWNIPAISFQEELHHQRSLVSGPALPGSGGRARVCGDAPQGVPTLAGLLHPCARHKLVEAMVGLSPRSLPPAWLAVLALLLVVTPGGRGWRAGAAGVGVFWGAAGSFAVGAAWVTYFHRYVLPLAVPLAALVPVAVARLVALVSRWRPLPAVLGAGRLEGGVALAILLAVWPGVLRTGRQPSFAEPDCGVLQRCDPWENYAIARWAEGELAPGDLVLSCAEMGLGALLQEGVRREYGAPFTHHCRAYIQRPPQATGTTWLAVWDPRTVPAEAQPGTTLEDFDLATIEAAGWEEVTAWREGIGRPANIHLFRRRSPPFLAR